VTAPAGIGNRFSGLGSPPLDSASVTAYVGTVVKPPLINLEEKIDRFVGKRTKAPNALSTATSNIADAVAWQKALGGLRIPRGVYRFKTHEEADAWMVKMLARSKVQQP
jgi:hypothetical protein